LGRSQPTTARDLNSFAQAHSQPVSSYKIKRRYHKYAGVASDSGVVSGTHLNPVSAHLL